MLGSAAGAGPVTVTHAASAAVAALILYRTCSRPWLRLTVTQRAIRAVLRWVDLGFRRAGRCALPYAAAPRGRAGPDWRRAWRAVIGLSTDVCAIAASFDGELRGRPVSTHAR